ncbi:hypothetical protein CVT26_009325 [Gymnopilus dilepis]|uniref:BTB domain-containing protein n=1 Tax=Gymnopilus dilepis TaxID=231916 RepID=A0A409YA59_9AGAR|nr:hypothetical protein CVT26_009325 [Gymnopilus dilepis]
MASPASLSPANLEALRQLLPTLATNCTGTPTPSRSKSKSFWLEDGNVIIETPDLQFRVYRGLLSRHSPYFESVLASSEDAQGNFSTHCPTVFLWNDSASDWERVLRVLVNNDTSIFTSDNLDLDGLASILRIGKKYEFLDLCKRGLDRICDEVPLSLEEWDELFNAQEIEEFGIEPHLAGKEIDLLNLLIEFDIQPLLPAAYYICVQNLTLHQIFLGTPRPDGTTSKLSHDSIQKLVLGREKISLFMWRHQIGWSDSATPLAPLWLPHQCGGCQHDRAGAVLDLGSQGPNPRGALFHPNKLIPLFKRKCLDCSEKNAERYVQGRIRIWNDLPSSFDLPSWEELGNTLRSTDSQMVLN